MELTLAVISDQKYALREPKKVIGEERVTIGRGEECDWVLPDPNNVVSRKHCFLDYKEGGFYITDVSRHGVLINHQPMEKNTPVRLADGAVLTFGDYEIAVKLSVRGEPVSQENPIFSEVGGGRTENPFDRLVSRKLVELLRPPPRDLHEVEPVKSHMPLAGLERSGHLDTEWYKKILPEPSKKEEPAPQTGKGEKSAQGTVDTEQMPTLDALPQGTGLQSIEILPEPSKKEGPALQTGEAEKPARGTVDTDQMSALDAFLHGTGLQSLEIPPEQVARVMMNLGAIFRETIRGVRAILEARRDIKADLRVYPTLWGRRPNPLKVLPTVDEIMKVVLTEDERFMPPAEAIREGLSDIKAHELAMWAGMQAVRAELLQWFDPQHLEQQLGHHSVLGNLLPMSRKAKYWELFHEHYQRLAQEFEEGYQDRFWREFARAYEEQIRKLS
jgi:type VI secretion system protein